MTLELWKSNKTIDEIAEERGFVVSTIEKHLAYYVGKGELPVEDFIRKDKLKIISKYIKEHPTSSTGEIRTGLKEKVSYSKIRFVLQHLIYENKSKV